MQKISCIQCFYLYTYNYVYQPSFQSLYTVPSPAASEAVSAVVVAGCWDRFAAVVVVVAASVASEDVSVAVVVIVISVVGLQWRNVRYKHTLFIVYSFGTLDWEAYQISGPYTNKQIKIDEDTAEL